MANILSLKRRIGAAKNVSKTTKAMQMIAASKLKRAQDAVLATRPYVHKISEMTTDVMGNIDKNFQHPYLQNKNAAGKTLLVVLSPDKGLCGGLITNLVREFALYHQEDANTSYVVMGKKLEGKVVQLNKEIIASFAFGTTLPSFDMVYPLMKIIDEYYIGKKVDAVKFLTTEYTSIFTQKPKIIQILPIVSAERVGIEQENYYKYEPDKKLLLNFLLKHYVEMSVYQQLIESFLSEQAARMISMQNATNNANDIIEDLQLEYNKTRQAKITSEILDITGANIVQK